MLNRIIAFSLKNKLIVGLLLLALVAVGVYQVTQLPIDAVPDITDNQVQVITVATSLGAPDVERLVTFPVEQANSNIPKLKEIRSLSRAGLSLVTIVFEDDVDLYWARQQVSERLKNAETLIAKQFGTPFLAPITTGLGEIYQYVLKPKTGYEAKYNITELRTIQDWIIRRQLLGVKGVADISSLGGNVKQYEIAINPAILKAHNITISDVFSALEKNNENTSGAYIENTSTATFIRSDGLVKTIDDINNIVVKNLANGTPLSIKDVAEVRIGKAVRYGALTYDDKGEVAGGIVMMLKGENSNRVIESVKEKIAEIQKTLPEGVVIEPFLDRTKMVNSAINTVTKNLFEGALIVVFILVLFLGNYRAGFIVASVIPLAMLFAISMMNLFGVSGNLMSLGALDFGLIVDGAVIIVEAVMHTMHEEKHDHIDSVVQSSASRMMNSAVFGQIIILIVYLPIFTLEGIEGKMFKPMAQTVAFALLGAFILSLTYIPVMSALLLKNHISGKKNISDKLMDFFTNIQQKYLVRVLEHPKLVIGSAVGLLAISLVLFSFLGGEFIPELPEGDFVIETRLLPGSNVEATNETNLKMAHILLAKFPEVEKVVGKTGSGEIPTDPMPMEASDVVVSLKDKSKWTSASSWNELKEKMQTALEEIPGVTFSIQYPVAMRFNELMTGAKQDVVLKIYGENLDTLAKYSKLLGAVAAKIDGAENIYVEPINGLPQLLIEYDRGAIAQFGLNIQDVNNVVNTAFAGQSCGLVYEDEKRFEMVVRLQNAQQKNVEDVRNLLIPTPNGSQIPLHQIANVAIKESVNQVQHEGARRRIIVGFNVGNRDVQSIVEDFQKQIEQKIKLPSEYFITYGGAFKNLEAAKKRLAVAVPVSLLLIFVFLFFAFNSVKQGLLIYSAIPLSAIGGILFLALRGLPFSISAGVGFIALFGVAVLNGIVLLAEFNRLRKEATGNEKWKMRNEQLATNNQQPTTNNEALKQIVLDGTKHRLRPVLMTAFVASLGFLPMALSGGAGAEVQRPLATVVIGGLFVATLLTLFVLPVLYILFEKTGTKQEATSNKKMLSIGLLLIACCLFSDAQTPISLEDAIALALKNNLQVKNEMLNAAYQKKLKGAAVDIPQTSVSGQYGQYNSIFLDNQISISQSLSFPVVYAKQKSLQNEMYKSSLFSVALKNAELKKQVASTFYLLVYLKSKQEILLATDTIYAGFLQKANLRFTKGEASILEKTTAETQRGQIVLQLNQLENDIEVVQLQFQLLLNTETVYVPMAKQKRLPFAEMLDTTVIEAHPKIKMLEQEQQITKASTQLEKSKLAPNLNLGFTNTTIRGMGANDVFYTTSKRFNYGQFGIGIPLFFGSQLSRINAQKVQQQIAENNYRFGLQSLKTELETALKNYETQLKNVQYFETMALPNADLITNTANKQVLNGDIDYLQWVMLINNATAIRSNYADALKGLNQAIIELNYLNNGQ